MSFECLTDGEKVEEHLTKPGQVDPLLLIPTEVLHAQGNLRVYPHFIQVFDEIALHGLTQIAKARSIVLLFTRERPVFLAFLGGHQTILLTNPYSVEVHLATPGSTFESHCPVGFIDDGDIEVDFVVFVLFLVRE